jgi:hypothetical protein
MKRILIATAFGLGLLGTGAMTTGTALASGKHSHHVYGGYSAHNFIGVWLYGPPRHYSHGHRHNFRHDYRRDYRHIQRPNHRNQFMHNSHRRNDRRGHMNR